MHFSLIVLSFEQIKIEKEWFGCSIIQLTKVQQKVANAADFAGKAEWHMLPTQRCNWGWPNGNASWSWPH